MATVGIDPAVVTALGRHALGSIAHRGPDDEGTWSDEHAWLGNRRLAIIDLSARGHQPMIDEPTGVVITYNGEIYNYIELRAELESAGRSFQTHTDTEVLLAAYLTWGPACLGRLNGMWSFMVWDPRTQTAFFSRDRLGVKPLYFTLAKGGLSVGSEPKALLALHPELRRVDETALHAFLAEGQLYTEERSFYSGIRVLEAGHYGTFQLGASTPRIQRYWSTPPGAESPVGYEEALHTFGQLFADAVRLRMRSDVPVGFTLSGGLDSSAVLQAAVAAVGATRGKLQAFTSVYPTPPGSKAVDERRWATLVAGMYEGVELEQVLASDTDWLHVLDRIVWHMDGPGYSPAVFPLWKIMERARASGVPVLLEGQGADELLGGYTQYAAVALWESLSPRRLTEFPRSFRAYATTFSAKMLALWFVRERLSIAKAAYRRRIGALGTLEPDFIRRVDATPPPRPSKTLNSRLSADLTRDILPGLLHYGDAISMAHSIETRLPFLDYRLVEFVSSLPGSFKVGDGTTKRILRDHLRTVGLDAIADRRDKRGYPTPADDWLRAEGGSVLRSILLSRNAEIRAYCRPERLERLIDLHVRGRGGAGNHLYRLLTTELWLRGLREAAVPPRASEEPASLSALAVPSGSR